MLLQGLDIASIHTLRGPVAFALLKEAMRSLHGVANVHGIQTAVVDHLVA
jgi:hypothetical protein